MKFVAVIALAVFGLFIIGELSNRSKSPDTRRAEVCVDGGQQDAYYASRAFVRQKLKSPSSAEFPNWYNSGEIAVSLIGDCKFRVVAHVDSQNSFGAVLRLPYVVTLEYRPNTNDWYGETELIE